VSGRRINPNRVKIHRNYTARGLADSLGVHKNTIRHWQRNGLAPIDNQRPYLFHGAAVRAFLAEWNKRRKRPCPPGMIYCFRCREPRRPIATSVQYVRSTAILGNLRAPCSTCRTIMHRRVRREAIHSVLPGLLVQITEAPSRLNGSSSPSLNCDFERQTST
jgi:hypothetical protein